jgi:hypothetical protein
MPGLAPGIFISGAILEHDPEKRVAVFRKGSCSNKKMEGRNET